MRTSTPFTNRRAPNCVGASCAWKKDDKQYTNSQCLGVAFKLKNKTRRPTPIVSTTRAIPTSLAVVSQCGQPRPNAQWCRVSILPGQDVFLSAPLISIQLPLQTSRSSDLNPDSLASIPESHYFTRPTASRGQVWFKGQNTVYQTGGERRQMLPKSDESRSGK